QVRDAPQLQAHMRRELQVRPVAVEVLDHIHRAVLELPAKLGANDIRLHHGVGPDLAHQLQARFALLIAHTGLEGDPVDGEDHGLLLLRGTEAPPGAPVSCRLAVAAMGHGRGCLLAVSLAPVCVTCHHAGCVIACRIRAPAGALFAAALIASDSLRHPPAAPRHRGVTAIPPVGSGSHGPEPGKGASVTAGTASRTAHLLAVMNKGGDLRPGPPGHGRGSVTRTGTQGALAAAAVAFGGCWRGSRNLRDA